MCRMVVALLAMFLVPSGAASSKIWLASQLNADPSFFDGRDVIVKGYAIFGTHSHYLLESKAMAIQDHENLERGIPSTPESEKECLTLINQGILSTKGRNYERLAHHTLVLRGKFFAHYGDKVVDLGSCSNASGFTIKQLIRATK